MLGAGSPYPSVFCFHFGAADCHRRGCDGHHATGLLPFNAGGLESGDPGNV